LSPVQIAARDAAQAPLCDYAVAFAIAPWMTGSCDQPESGDAIMMTKLIPAIFGALLA